MAEWGFDSKAYAFSIIVQGSSLSNAIFFFNIQSSASASVTNYSPFYLNLPNCAPHIALWQLPKPSSTFKHCPWLQKHGRQKHRQQNLRSSGTRRANRIHLTHSGSQNCWAKKTMRPTGKECCDQSVMSAMGLGRRVASYMLCICQWGLHSTCQKSNLIELLKVLCICESAMALTIHHANFATEITCYSASRPPLRRTRRQWHSLSSSWEKPK